MSKAKNTKNTLQKRLKTPKGAATHLNSALEEGSLETFLAALKEIAEANQGKMADLAEEIRLKRKTLSKALFNKKKSELRKIGE